MRVVHRRKESFTHYIGRGSTMGNPFTHLPLSETRALVQVPTLAESIQAFREWAEGNPKWAHIDPKGRLRMLQAIRDLPEYAILACYCKPNPCHGDVIVEIWKEIHNPMFAATHGPRRLLPVRWNNED